MALLNFPKDRSELTPPLGIAGDALQNGDIYELNSITYVYTSASNDDARWQSEGSGGSVSPGASVHVGDAPPASSDEGDLWFNTDDGRLYVYFNDGNTSQWVDASPNSEGGSSGGSGGGSINSGPTFPSTGTVDELFFNTTDGRLYIYYFDGDTSQWVDASPDSQTTPYWDRTGTTLSPSNAGDDVDLGNIQLNADGSASFAGTNFQVFSSGSFSAYKATTTAVDTLVSVKSDIGSTKNEVFQIGADGSAVIAGNGQPSGAITLNANGTVNAASLFAKSTGVTTDALSTGVDIKNAGNFTMAGIMCDGTGFFGGQNTATANIVLNSDGSTKCDVALASNQSAFSVNNQANGAGNTYYLYGLSANGGEVRIQSDGSCYFSGDIGIGGTNAASPNILLNAGGTAYKPGGGSWSSTSDERSKEAIVDYTSGLAEVKQLQPRSYSFIGNENTYIGLVAQEAEGAMPEMVSQGEGTLPDGTEVDDFRTLDSTALTFALVNAVKELSTHIEALEAEVQALKGGN